LFDGDAAPLHDLDVGVTAGAGVGDVLRVERRARIVRREEIVLAMTIRADSGFEHIVAERLPVHALYVLCVDLDMTPSAGLGDVRLIHGRERVCRGAHGVNGVTALAIRGVGVAALERLPVDALFIFLWALAHGRAHNIPLIVTLQTVNLFGASLMGDGRHVGVTIYAEFFFVHGYFELLIVNIKRLELPGDDFALEVGLAMTF